VTQAYFPGDPLLAFDPILHAIRDERARARLVAAFDWGTTTEGWALGFRFDIVVGGHLATPLDPDEA
jgi:protocatechuate 3,4-dioxygenase beta subunit